MPKPVAVLISDVHYNLPNLALAEMAMNQAIDKANTLDVPLVVAGDLHDTKANLRGECVNALLRTVKKLDYSVPLYALRGNHDAIHEKSKEHSLEFIIYEYDGSQVRQVITVPTINLEPYGDTKLFVNSRAVHFIPYHHDANELRGYLNTIAKGSTLIMHQGLTSSNMGDYIQDKSAINPEDVAGMRVISGHYHARQTIELPDGGEWDYIGNPYTVSYGEANDPEKGFQILMDDGSLEFIPTNLRKHIIFEGTLAGLEYDMCGLNVTEQDLVKVKLVDKRENLLISKEEIARKLKFITPFRLDLLPIGTESKITTKNITKAALIDSLIDSLSNTSDERKFRLKSMWRDLCE